MINDFYIGWNGSGSHPLKKSYILAYSIREIISSTSIYHYTILASSFVPNVGKVDDVGSLTSLAVV